MNMAVGCAVYHTCHQPLSSKMGCIPERTVRGVAWPAAVDGQIGVYPANAGWVGGGQLMNMAVGCAVYHTCHQPLSSKIGCIPERTIRGVAWPAAVDAQIGVYPA